MEQAISLVCEQPKVTRRTLLTGLASITGAAIGSGAVTGFPIVWAQKLNDITLVQVGGSYSSIIDIGRQATKDLGFEIKMQNAVTDALVNRAATQPESIDIADLEFWSLKKLLRRQVLRPIEVTKIKEWDKIVPIFTKGEYPDGRKVSTQGILPYEVQYVEGPDATGFATGPTDYATIIPIIYNADTLGIRPDLISRPIETWAELLNPAFQGKAAILDVPSIGIMDAAMAIEARGDVTYGDKGNMTQEELDKTIAILIETKSRDSFVPSGARLMNR